MTSGEVEYLDPEDVEVLLDHEGFDLRAAGAVDLDGIAAWMQACVKPLG
ncbi:hypothetical protein BJ978_000331 [Agromyces terreus]|uniref:Uncharacterized protein n=1 Tax=Agromyces terreus TaxID=424795 RepID=A0A9X2KB11_9MICO|nr:hypothetical protein [Agromyces terreus]MCP2369655.1 hypothetical protein [Agromyces terreus]